MVKIVVLFLVFWALTERQVSAVEIRILDEKGEKVSFANVSVDRFMWVTCSNEEGVFEVTREWLVSGVEFEITHLGYAPCRISGKEIVGNGYVVRMTFQSLELKEVVILPEKVMRKKGKDTWQKILKNWEKNQWHESYLLHVHNLIVEHENDSMVYVHESNGEIFRFGYTPQLCPVLSQSYRSGNDFLRLFRVRESAPAGKGNYLFLISGYPYHFMVQEYFVIRKKNPEVVYWEENNEQYYLEIRYDIGWGDSGQLNVWADKQDYSLQKVEKTEHVVIEQKQKIDALTHEIWKYGKNAGGIYPLSYSVDLVRYQRGPDGQEWIGNRLQRAYFTGFSRATEEDYKIFFPESVKKTDKPDYKRLLVKDYSFWAVATYREEDWKQVLIPGCSGSDLSRLKKEFRRNYQHRWQYENSNYE